MRAVHAMVIALAASAAACNGRLAPDGENDASCTNLDSGSPIFCDYDARDPYNDLPWCPPGTICRLFMRSVPGVCVPPPDEAGCCSDCLVIAEGYLRVQKGKFVLCIPPSYPRGVNPHGARCLDGWSNW